jgi:hypothetical protein
LHTTQVAYGILFAVAYGASVRADFNFHMPKLPRLFFTTLLILFLSPVAVSAAPSDLYTGEATVTSQSVAERNKAMPLALLQVLQKLSGLRFFEDYPLVAESLNNSESLLVSFHYRNQEATLADGSAVDEMKLVARFSEPGVDELVQTLALPLWQPERGNTEIWVVVDDGLDRRILPVEFQYAWDAMNAAAADRGMPVIWPQADEDGQYPVDDQLLWGGYTEDLKGSGSGGVMVAAARREGAEWSVRINLAYNDDTWTWRNRDLDLQFLLAESIQQAADQIAAANTIAASDRGSTFYLLTVNGIGGADEYARCLTYLESLSVVDRVTVESARAGQVRYRLQLNALPQYLEDTLASGRVLKRDDPDDDYLLIK